MVVNVETIVGYLSMTTGFQGVLQMDLIEADAARATISLSLSFRPEFTRIPAVGDYHGGVLASALDVAGTCACMLATGRMTPTGNLRVDYLKSPAKCDLIATGRVLKAGRRFVIADAEVADGAGSIFAVARGTWVVPQS